MQIVETKVSRRKTPPGACVEFVGANGESIEVELRGDDFADMADTEIVSRAKVTMSGAGSTDIDALSDDVGVDQTLDRP